MGLLCAASLLAACPDSPPEKPEPKQRVRVRSFTEASAVQELVTVSPYAFVATASGLDRWDLRSGQRLHLASEHGLPSDHVIALDYDAERRWLWVATDRGITRYELDTASFTDVPPPPEDLGLENLEGATLAAASDGGIWIGLPVGLYYADSEGNWRHTAVTAPVTSLFTHPDHRLWVGTRAGLFESRIDGAAYRLGPEQGCDLARVRFIERGPGGAPVVVGENGAGEQRVILEDEDGRGCASYRTSPEKKWVAAAPGGESLVILTEGRLYAMRRPRSSMQKRLMRDGMRLLRLAPSPRRSALRGPYVLRPVGGKVPDGARTLAATEAEILVGTRSLGTALVAPRGRRSSTRWLRRRELARDATTLSVACAARDDCYIATGSSRFWHFDGESFEDTGGGERRILAVVRESDQTIYGLRHSLDGIQIEISRVEDGAFSEPEFVVDTPGGRPELTFARFSPAETLWLGLAYRDAAGDRRPYGVALVDVDLGVVAYHHASHDEEEAEQGVLPIPIGVIDVAFAGGGETWLATSQGAARIRGTKEVSVFSEGEGMRSEMLRGVACASDGTVYVASHSGVGVLEDGAWSYPRMLGWTVNDLEMAPDGRLWMATERGLAVYDGERVRRLDARRGLLEDHIESVALDHFGRVWVLGDQGIGLVTP